MQNELYIGVMSGTSLDGIDLALMELGNNHTKLLNTAFFEFPADLKTRLLALHSGKTTLQNLGELHQALGYMYAEQINLAMHQWQVPSSAITAIGCHGQTVWHSPPSTLSPSNKASLPNSGKIFSNSEGLTSVFQDRSYPFTMQLGNGQIIACETGITTVCDFRNKDIALGGQSAPLVPAFHQAILFNPDFQTAILNMGGISNLSLLSSEQVLGFDTGTGNALLDNWINQHLSKSYDANGNWAKTGKVLPEFLDACLKDPYFQLSPPKSTGREYFNLAWLQAKIAQANYETAKPQDIQASLVELTVQCNVKALKQWQQSALKKRLILCGGGARNPLIVAGLKRELPEWQVHLSDEFGISVDYMEACAFAWLAYRRMHNLPSNLPSVTGASALTSLGTIYVS